MGAITIAPPIAAAANHGASRFVVVFMVFSLLAFALLGLTPIISLQHTDFATADTQLGLAASWNSSLDFVLA
jgi:hypothetical protein